MHDTFYVQHEGGKAIYTPPQTSKKLDQQDINLAGDECKTYT